MRILVEVIACLRFKCRLVTYSLSQSFLYEPLMSAHNAETFVILPIECSPPETDNIDHTAYYIIYMVHVTCACPPSFPAVHY